MGTGHRFPRGVASTLARSDAGRNRRGFSYLELTVAIATAMVGTLAFSNALLTSQSLSESSRERSIAVQAGRRMLEELQEGEFSDTWALYNSSAADDPVGPDPVPGSGFAVDGLDPVDGDPDGVAGEIRFPDLESDGALVLREDVKDVRLGTPRDLNSDGVIDAQDHALDYALLPVVVRVEWRGRRGHSFVELRTLLADR